MVESGEMGRGGLARNCGMEIVGVGVAAAAFRTVMSWLICLDG